MPALSRLALACALNLRLSLAFTSFQFVIRNDASSLSRSANAVPSSAYSSLPPRWRSVMSPQPRLTAPL